jgi:hypothetical protein
MGSRGQSVRATGFWGRLRAKEGYTNCAARRKKPRAEVRGLVAFVELCARGAKHKAPQLSASQSVGRAVPARHIVANIANQAAGAAARAAADKRGVTRLQPHIHDARAMSACAPTADVSLERGR